MELQDIIASDPAAMALFREWRAVRTLLAREIGWADANLGEFVLFAMYECGRADALTDSERAWAEEVAPAFRRMLADSPGMAAIAGDIRRDMEDFEAHWAAWFAPEASPLSRPFSGRVAAPARADRPARPARFARPLRRVGASGARRRVLQAGVGLVAAALLAALGVLLWPSASPDVVTIQTAAAEVRLVELPDGSVARLLGDSRVTYSPVGTSPEWARSIAFEGRAFFDIAPRDDAFLLLTPDAEVAVLGTSFGAHAAAEGTEIVLVEGNVRMRARYGADDADPSVVLGPGQMSRMAAGVPSDPVSVRVHERLAWTGLFLFHTTPVRDILPVLSAHYGAAISAEEALLDERVTGRFAQDESLAETLDIVALAIGASVEADDAGYRIVSSR